MNWEFQILDHLQELRTPLLDWLMPKISFLGNAGILWLLLAVILLCQPKYRRIGQVMVFALLCDLVLCNGVLKPIGHRIRPYEYRPELQLLVEKCTDYSFPSGHTAASFAAVTALYLAWKQNRWAWKLAFIPAALIAFSRLYLYVHYPTDVFAGVLLGLLCGWLGYQIQLFIDRKRKGKRENGQNC